MIAFIKGIIEETGEEYIVIDNNGIGYHIGMSPTEIEKLKKLEGIVKIYTYQHVREDNISLFGFLDNDKLNMFKLLIGVSGVGPKAAIAMLSAVDPQSLILAIITADEKTICKAQGVGKKLAQRIILELKDKFKNYNPEQQITVDTGFVTEELEAVGALMALGYNRAEAMGAMKNIDTNQAIEEVVKQALKTLMRG